MIRVHPLPPISFELKALPLLVDNIGRRLRPEAFSNPSGRTGWTDKVLPIIQCILITNSLSRLCESAMDHPR